MNVLENKHLDNLVIDKWNLIESLEAYLENTNITPLNMDIWRCTGEYPNIAHAPIDPKLQAKCYNEIIKVATKDKETARKCLDYLLAVEFDGEDYKHLYKQLLELGKEGNDHRDKLEYHLNLIDQQINDALAELNQYKPYPEEKEWHKTLISISDKVEALIENVNHDTSDATR